MTSKELTVRKNSNLKKYIITICIIVLIAWFADFSRGLRRLCNDNDAYFNRERKILQFIKPNHPAEIEHYIIELAYLIDKSADLKELPIANQHFILKKIVKWMRLLAYDNAASKLPEDDQILKFLKYRAMVSVYRANDANAWNIYDKALEDVKLLSKDAVDFAVRDNNMKLTLRAYYISKIVLNLSNPEFIKILKHSNPAKYQYFYKFFDAPLHNPKIYSYQPPSLNKEGEYSANLLAQSAYTILIMNKCSVDLSDRNISCNSAQGDDLVKQFNRYIADAKKFISHWKSSNASEEPNINIFANDINGLTTKLINMCPCRARELDSL
ncbi:MAG: hypothetical protein K0R73_549 [Candidatus Midichloriaceae bacterium]|jgi:hypothetical protein|nr:hypothetical protein [Candidatus Midichloriaceae bacterium]